MDFIHFIQQFRGPWIDPFFVSLNFFDTQWFFFLVLPFIWQWQGWKKGISLFYLIMLSGLINHFLKHYFELPRPFHLDEEVGIIQVSGFGFPSGAAQTVILLSGWLIANWQSRWKWPVVGLYVGLVSFSRLFLGVHFPMDVLGGWIVGFFLLGLYFKCLPLFEKGSARTLLVMSQTLPSLLIWLDPSPTVIRLAAVSMGIGLGQYLAITWALPERYGFVNAIIMIVGSIGLYFLLPNLLDQFYLIGVWVPLSSQLTRIPQLCLK